MRKVKKYSINIKKVISSFFYRSPIKIKGNSKIVSFTFDDVPKSTFNNAIPILDKYSIKGTFYVALSLMERENKRNGLFTEEDVHKCINSGHELGCHSYSHIHFCNINNGEYIKNDLTCNLTALQILSPGRSFKNFSYPFGEQTITGKRIVSNLYTSCRGTDYGMNLGKTDLNNLKAIKLYESKNSPEEIYSILNGFSQSGGWLIFYTHDVQENFSSSGCSPQYLESVIRKCIDLGIEIKSIEQTIASFDLRDKSER